MSETLRDHLSLTQAACDVLNTANPQEKVRRTFHYVSLWQDGHITEIGDKTPPRHPARPKKPELLNPRDMPRRRPGTTQGRIAFIHSITHIELNAIDIAWDMIARFKSDHFPKEFYDDWVQVAYDEAVHFQLLNDRLADFDATYGDCPAHNGLWDAALDSMDDVMARCALVPMLLEPRGLDTTPSAVKKLRNIGDDKTADIMQRIGMEELPHVAAGTRWFNFEAKRRGLDAPKTYQDYIRSRFNGILKSPFNEEARTKAGLTPDYYIPVSDLADT